MKILSRIGFLTVLALGYVPTLHAQFVISEFMADNVTSSDIDEDTNHSDWIEIQNTGTTSASLNGWYLTDDAAQLRKWQFPVTLPAVTVPGTGRITVWASNKNRKASASRLHTNFRLANSGEYLALVRPDGVTIEHAYGPTYPAQFPNGTYGISATVSTQVLVAETAAGKAKVATSLADFTTNFVGWNSSPTFDDSLWQAGNSGFGFGTPFTGLLGVGGDISAMMLNQNGSCFLRYTFSLAPGITINTMRLRLKFDDGYIAFINGTQIGQTNPPASPTWNSNASGDRTDSLAGSFSNVTPANGPGALVSGTNILAIQMLNSSASNANVLMRPQLEVDAVTSTSIAYLTSPTRGAANSTPKTSVGPAISDTTDKPAQPTGGVGSANLLITTKVTPTLRPLATVDPVVLKSRIMFGAETSIVMVDNGTNGDLTAGDSIYTAQIPTTTLTAGQMIRWRVEAKDNTTIYSYHPAYPVFSPTTPPANPPSVDALAEYEQYFGTIATPTLVGNTTLPVLHWYFTGADNSVNATGTRGSFFWQPLPKDNPGPGYTPPKPRFYDNVLVNIHGQSSSGFPVNKKSHDLSFSKDNKFLWKDGEPESSGTNLLTNYADKSKTRNPTAWWVWEKSGHLASHFDTMVRVQQNNTFKGIYDIVENANASWLARQKLDEAGALYKVYNSLEGSAITTGNNSVEKKNPDDGDSSDLAVFVAGIADSNTMTNRLKFTFDNADIPSLVNLLATSSLLVSRDFGHKNYYIYRDSHGTLEWSLLPWDQDLSLGHTWNATPGYWDDDIHSQAPLQIGTAANLSSPGGNRLMSILYNTPELNYMFVRRLRTLADQFLVSGAATDGPLDQHINAIINQIDPNPNNPAAGIDDADLDMRAWGYWTDGAGGASVSYTNINVLDHTARTQALRITSANPVPPNPGSPAPYAGWGDNSTSLLPFTPGRRAFFYNAVPPASNSTAFPNTNAAFPASQPLNPNLIIEQIDYNPAAGTQDQEYFVIRNPNSYSVDISGWKLSGDINMTFRGGTVIPSQGTPTSQATNTSYVNQLIVANKPQGFRTRTSSPMANEYRFVTGPYDRQLSARGGSIILSRPNEPLNSATLYTPLITQAFAGVPTVHQNFIRITELNFRPAPATGAELTLLPGLVAGDFEFIELTNNGPATLSLAGAYFEEGIEFKFPTPYSLASGARCLVVASQPAFEVRYGTGHPIAGEFSGSLNNGGEVLRLVDPVGEELLQFTYDNAWFPLPIGTYRSLVTVSNDPAYNAYSTPTTWALSGNPNGSPNAPDASLSHVYEGWRLSHFTNAELPTLVNPNLPAALTADPDGDGLSNFAEYAFGTNPKIPNTPGQPASNVVTVGPETFTTISFKRPKNALDVTYYIETCPDLDPGNWAALDNPVTTVIDLGNGYEQVTCRDTVSREVAPRRFLQARAIK